MQDWIIDIMNHYGYLGIVFLIAIENVFPPIPSEVILTFGGFMTTPDDSNLTVWGVIFAATLGAVIGAVILYGVGRLISAERMAKLLDGRIGKVLRLKKEDVFKACDWFNSKGKNSVLFGRCVPIIRSLISIPAGMTKMKFPIFLCLTAFGSFVWNVVLVHLGVAAGASWEKVVAGTDVLEKVTIVVIGVLVIIAGFAFYNKFIKKEK